MVEIEYAKAIYELALEEKKEDVFMNAFEFVSNTLKDEEFYKILTSPFISTTEKKDLIIKIYKNLDDTFLNFLKVLVDHNRISNFKDIYDSFIQNLMEYRNIVKIEIFSAVKLSKNQMLHVTEALQAKYDGKKIEIENIVDETLIGGIHIVSNGESLDMSLRNSLNKLKESL